MLKNVGRTFGRTSRYTIRPFRLQRAPDDKQNEKQQEAPAERMASPTSGQNNSLLLASADTSLPYSQSSSQTMGNESSGEAIGTRVEKWLHFDVIRDTNDGITTWWWLALYSGSRLLTNPAVVRLSTTERMLNALWLISDIISVGKLILKFHRQDVRDLLRDPRVQKALNSTPKVVCNKILEELDLEDWGKIDNDEIQKMEMEYPTGSDTEYGILFFVLTVTSDMYSEKRPVRYSGQTLIDDLHKVGDGDQFFDEEKKLAKKWFDDWTNGEAPGNNRKGLVQGMLRLLPNSPGM